MADTIKERLYPLPPLLASLEKLIELFPRQRVVTVCKPHSQIVVIDGETYKATGNTPRFSLEFDRSLDEGCWLYLEAALSRHSGNREARFIVEMGNGQFVETPVPANLRGTIREVIYLPAGFRKVYWSPMAEAGYFAQSELQLHRISGLEAWMRRTHRALTWTHAFRGDEMRSRGLATPLGRLRNLQAAYELTAWAQIRRYSSGTYADFLARNKQRLHPPRQEMIDKIAAFTSKPLFSLLVVADTGATGLSVTLESIHAQVYPEWEVFICGRPNELAGWTDRAYASEQVHVRAALPEQNFVDTWNEILGEVKGQWVMRLPAGVRLTEEALFFVAEALQKSKDTALIYADHDYMTEAGELANPCFKPDWNTDMFTATHYIQHPFWVNRQALERAGGWRAGYDGAEDYDLLLRITSKPDCCVLHLHRVLANLPESMAQDNARNHDSGKRALQSRFAGTGVKAEDGLSSGLYHVRYPLPTSCPLVSILVPTRDKLDILKTCIESVVSQTTYPNWEIVIIDNQSVEESTRNWLKKIQQDPRITVIQWNHPFNYSAINNVAATQAKGEVLVLLNNDIEIITKDWLEEMVRHAIRPEIGAVGVKLLYPNGLVQHAGVVLGIGGLAGHVHRYLGNEETGYCQRANLTQNYSAVTAACLAVKKSKYFEVGGLDEVHFKVAYNDVDFCIKLVQAGYRNIYTPHVSHYHYESLSRGRDDTAEKIRVFEYESEYLKKTYNELLMADQSYNQNLNRENEYFQF